ncbi:electron transport complex protein RnfE [Desulfatibacillum alkenivorans DSM 16219]|jgi:electron transport complex protein RnfE|uniref:Ion-translocating oxidoreductase complex subunit E n=1 Tax=Desulfatibacillum alkenivorans DSM 16219 TaxID=1121393 RepID=A0A1M6KJC2_9BACT|nr:electron transport complex subunit E [Desulfatibacillum alkenivorans]SHJ59063.1 electron transport complex protein RnfE [Desulfatibacillum alkenivorans DSM 16219]
MAKTLTQEFTKGLWQEIPPFRLVLGLCPALGVTTTVQNGVGMGLATTFVLVCANLLVSVLRKVIPAKVRIACFIVVIATFVTLVGMLMQAFTYPLYGMLGIFIPLIVVNCIVLGRAEAFAYKNPVLPSIADGLGIGLGFTMALGALGAVREVIGTGCFTVPFGPTLTILSADWYTPFAFMVQAPGAFIGLGLMLCLMNLVPSK